MLEAVVRDRSLLRALRGGTNAAAFGGRGRLQPGRRAARRWGKAIVRREKKAAKLSRDETVAGRDRDPGPAREAGVHDAECLPARRVRAGRGGRRPGVPRGRSSRSTATSASSTTSRSIRSTTSCARPCGDFNFAKRTETADLTGRVALLTGGRVKIGYQAGIKLLRAGAQLIVTTRFPRDAAARYAREADFDAWGDRLEIFGLDLRHTPSVEAFCTHLARRGTGSTSSSTTPARPCAGRPSSTGTCSKARRAAERAAGHGRARCSASTRASAAREHALGRRVGRAVAGAAARGRPPQSDLFPEGRLDQDLQQVDLRDRNSWRLLLDEVSSVELLETQLVNAVAPFVLNARLKPLLLRTPDRDKHIVNVSAVEGQFYRRFKTTRHPHTNMAKAALNMMTRTSAADYYADGIHMNSVDTGWVTDEDPVQIAEQKRPSTGSARRSTSSTARRASSTRSSTASTPASTSGASS